MSNIKHLKLFGKIIAAFFILLIGYLLISICLSIIPVPAKENTDKTIDIYLMTNGVHTDIVMPVNNPIMNWGETLISHKEEPINPIFRYIAVGWGNKEFYLNTPTWGDLKVKTALQAISGTGGSVLHITWYRDIMEDENTVKISLSREQYRALADFITAYTKKDKEGDIIPVAPSSWYTLSDRFYEAKGNYSLFFTCNTWTNKALKVSGQKACVWTPFSQGIFYQYRHQVTVK